MKAIVVLIIGLALLAGAVIASWTLYNEFLNKAAVQEEPEPEPPKPPAFVRFSGLSIPIFDEKRVRQFVTVVVTLQVDADKQPSIQGISPRVQNAMLTSLFDLAASGQMLQGTLANIPRVKSTLTDAVKAVLPDGGLQDVLIQVVMQRNV